MAQGSRPERVGHQIRNELADLLMREVHDPGVGFVTLTKVTVSPDLLLARVFYTTLGDATARRNTAKALERASGFLRRQIGHRLRLRRVPEIRFQYDEAIAGQDRIEQILHELHAAEAASVPNDAPEAQGPEAEDSASDPNAPHPSPEAESLRSRPRDGEARPASDSPEPLRSAKALSNSAGGGAPARVDEAGAPHPSPEAESLRSRPRDSEVPPASGGGAPRAIDNDDADS